MFDVLRFYALVVGAASLMTAIGVLADPVQTGLNGVVVVSPALPGPQRAGERAASPLSGAVVQLRDAQGTLVASELTDANGHFNVVVAAGLYEIQVRVRGTGFPRCKAREVTVRGGQITSVEIACDSGMR